MEKLTYLKLSLQLFISALIGLEVSLLPNPFIKPLIFLLVIYVALVYNIPDKSIDVIKRLNKFMSELE